MMIQMVRHLYPSLMIKQLTITQLSMNALSNDKKPKFFIGPSNFQTKKHIQERVCIYFE